MGRDQESSIADSGLPSVRLKIAFWILLGMLSTALAEVVSGSDPYPFFRPWGLIVTTPLYTLHILVLATVLLHIRSLTWQGLCFAGAVFGLYEAYITKVLWNPPWAQELALSFSGVAWSHTVLLVLWWHPLMAFALPLLIGETFLTRSRAVLRCLPPRLLRLAAGSRRRVVCAVLIAVGCGLVTSGNAPSAPGALLSTLANSAVLLGLMWLWRTRSSGTQYTLAALLPGPLGLAILVALLLLLYVATGALLRPDSFPGFQGHMAIWILYALFAILLARNRRLAREADDAAEAGSADTAGPAVLCVFAMVYAICASAASFLLGPSAGFFLLANWLFGGVIGLAVYARAIYTVCRAGPARA